MTVRIKAGKDAERVMPETPQTLAYIDKLSHAATVRVTFESGAWKEFECGLLINSGQECVGGLHNYDMTCCNPPKA